MPEQDIYIEITTLNQKLVTKKNGKVKRLMELYPEVHCKILYQRDYLNLLIKYGLEEPSQMKGALKMPRRPAPPGRDAGVDEMFGTG